MSCFFATVGGIITGLIFAKAILLSYEQLGLPFSSDMSGVWKAEDGQDEKVLEAGRILNEEIPHKVFSVDYTLYEINKAFGPILFIGLFIELCFLFLGSSSFFLFYSSCLLLSH